MVLFNCNLLEALLGISFLRQLVEHNGFYRPGDQAWVKLERIQFVGACNPPTDPGRKPLGKHILTIFWYEKEVYKSDRNKTNK